MTRDAVDGSEASTLQNSNQKLPMPGIILSKCLPVKMYVVEMVKIYMTPDSRGKLTSRLLS